MIGPRLDVAALGIPMPITLGAVAGLLNFVPNIGPIVAAIPAVLIGWTEGHALAVAILYFVLQMADGYIFTPLVQQRTVALPAALVIIAQLLAGVLAGTLGVLLATPLAAATMILVQRLYLEDVLAASERVQLARAAERE
jgi:predicted PurR-regulated permease PerM